MARLTREEIEQHFPESVALARAFRAVFGDGVRLLYAQERGRTLGKPSTASASLPPRSASAP